MQNKEQQREALIAKIEAGNQSLSFSAMKAFAVSPDDFVRYKLGDKVQTDAMLLGKVLHCLVLELDKFEERYFVLDDNNICAQIGGLKPRATKAYKEWKSGQMETIGDKEVVDMETYKQAFDMRNALYENEVTHRHLSKIVDKEYKIIWNHMDMEFTSFLDGVNLEQDNCIIIDLKKVVSAAPKKVERVIFDEMYFMQLEMYRMALKQKHDIDLELSKCYVVAVDATCHVSVHKVHEDLLRFGRQKLEYLIKKFNECTFKNKWHEGYEFYSEYGGIFLVDRPAYSYK